MLWVVNAKQLLGGPAQALEYLGRYTHRVAISNERILDMDGALTRQFVRRFGVGASHKYPPGYPFLPHPLPPPHDIGLTPHFKALQSP